MKHSFMAFLVSMGIILGSGFTYAAMYSTDIWKYGFEATQDLYKCQKEYGKCDIIVYARKK